MRKRKMTPEPNLAHPASKADLDAIAARWRAGQETKKYQLLVCAGAGCVSSGCHAVKHALLSAIKDAGLASDTVVHETGCLGSCHLGPTLVVQPDGVLYTELKPENMKGIVKQHLVHHEVVEAHCWVDPETKEPVPLLSDIEFFHRQTRLVTARCGSTPYASLEAYIASDGYQALAKVLAGMSREQVIQEMRASGLRGRGGGGFPVGAKWQAGFKAKGAEKIVVCNADEGDPGAFMDRSLLEGDPHAILEGMLVAGYAIGASQGYVYVRAEYPLAVERLEVAIRQAREWGLLGPNVMGTPFAFDVEIRIGAGAFVCGEETALMHSVEGKRGEPSQKPPFPFEKGSSASRRSYRTSRPSRTSRSSSAAAAPGSPRSAPRKAAGRRSSPSRERSRTPASSRSRWGSPSARSSTTSRAASRKGSASRRRRRAAPRAGASRASTSTPRSTTTPSSTSGRSWDRAASSSWTRTRAWSTSPASSSISSRTRAAASASPAASGRNGCSRS
jgi:(2Fe-2S) ferredoxin